VQGITRFVLGKTTTGASLAIDQATTPQQPFFVHAENATNYADVTLTGMPSSLAVLYDEQLVAKSLTYTAATNAGSLSVDAGTKDKANDALHVTLAPLPLT